MPTQIFVSGTVTVADDGSVSGSLSLSGGASTQPADPGIGDPGVGDPGAVSQPPADGPATEPAPGNVADQPGPGGDLPLPDGGPLAGDTADPSQPDPGLPPAPSDPGADQLPATPEQPVTDPATDGAADGGTADPTTAGAEAGTTDTTTSDTTTTGASAGGDTAGYPPYPGRDLRRDDAQHSSDIDIRAFQQAATDHGFTVGPVDGFFGPRTENGVRAIQAAGGVDATGVIDAGTWPLAWTATA